MKRLKAVATLLNVGFLFFVMFNLPYVGAWLPIDGCDAHVSYSIPVESLQTSDSRTSSSQETKKKEESQQTSSFSYVVSLYNSTHYSLINGTTQAVDYISTNVSEVINLAISNASTIKGTVYIENGTYKLTESIIPKSYVYVYAPHAVFLECNSSLLPPLNLSQTFNMVAHAHQNYPLYNFSLDGGIWDGQRRNLEITNDADNANYGGQTNGIYIYSDPPNGGFGIVIKNLVVRHIVRFGVAIFRSQQSLVENVTTIDVGHNGITIDAGGPVYDYWNHNAIVRNSYAEFSGDVGINVFYGRGVQLIDNTAINNTNPASMYKSNWGFASEFAHNVSFIRNQAFNQTTPTGAGIGLINSDDVVLIENSANNNSAGVSIHSSSNVSVSANNLESNNVGIEVYNSNSSSFFHNNLIVNNIQAKVFNIANVTWDNGSQGNYWSDYNGEDPDGDGIGNQPYTIPPDHEDRYPLMKPWPMTYPIIWEETTYLVSTISNSTIFKLSFNQLGRRISFDVVGPNDTIGFCNVTIPKALLDAPQDQWIVIIGSESPQPSVVSNLTHSSIYFAYTHSIQTVNIIGTNPADNTPPITNAGPDQTVNEDTWVTLNGSASWDNIEIATYSWFFTDGIPRILNGINPAYSFATPGIFTITLNVTDLRGNYDIDTVIVTVLDVTKPTAHAGIDQKVDEDTLVTFDGSASWDNVEIVNYVWTFMDETAQTLTNVNPTYTFATPGVFTVTLNVTDAVGNWDVDTVTITVLDVTNPLANAGSDQTVDEDTTVTFDGAASSDNVKIVTFVWSLMDRTPKTLTGVSPTYTFETPGIYTVTLNITDAAGNWAMDMVVITVLDITRPVANAGQDQTVGQELEATFDGSGSYDNVAIVNYTWTLVDIFPQFLNGVNPTHIFSKPGYYLVVLNVTDANGNWAADSLTVRVLDTKTPIVIFSISPKEGELYTGTTLTFDANNSSDNGEMVSYLWDFGDGNTDEGIIVTHMYSHPGRYTIELKVKDAADNIGTYALTIVILTRESPTYHFLIAVILTGMIVSFLGLFLRRKLGR